MGVTLCKHTRYVPAVARPRHIRRRRRAGRRAGYIAAPGAPLYAVPSPLRKASTVEQAMDRARQRASRVGAKRAIVCCCWTVGGGGLWQGGGGRRGGGGGGLVAGRSKQGRNDAELGAARAFCRAQGRRVRQGWGAVCPSPLVHVVHVRSGAVLRMDFANSPPPAGVNMSSGSLRACITAGEGLGRRVVAVSNIQPPPPLQLPPAGELAPPPWEVVPELSASPGA